MNLRRWLQYHCTALLEVLTPSLHVDSAIHRPYYPSVSPFDLLVTAQPPACPQSVVSHFLWVVLKFPVRTPVVGTDRYFLGIGEPRSRRILDVVPMIGGALAY